MINRIRTFQSRIKPGEAWLISNQIHIEYLTGFVSLLPTEREGFFWVTAKTAALIHAAFSPAPKNDDITYLQGCYSSELSRHISWLIQQEPIDFLLIDGMTLWHDEYRTLLESTENTSIKIVEQKKQVLSGSGSGSTSDTSSQHQAYIDPILNYRAIKDVSEIQAISEAGSIVAQAIEEVIHSLQPGMSEAYVCQQLEVVMRKMGSTQPAFPTIVGFGPNSALPHHQPSESSLLEEDMAILIDCGATVRRYRSDTTRSWWFGSNKPAEYATIESTVMEAYQAGITLLASRFEVKELTLVPDTIPKSNTSAQTKTKQTPTNQDRSLKSKHASNTLISAQMLDSECRSTIIKSGYGPEFIHTTGHGVGLDIHEAPSISSSNTSEIQAGMVITIEPGIYLQGKYGFRHENTILIQ